MPSVEECIAPCNSFSLFLEKGDRGTGIYSLHEFPALGRRNSSTFSSCECSSLGSFTPRLCKSSLPLPGLFSLPYVPNRLWQECSELQKVNIWSQSTEFWGSCALKAAKVLYCPDLESGCSGAGLPLGLLLQELRRRSFFFFLTLDSYLTKWLSQPNLRAQHKTSSCLMAQSGVCEVASETCLLGDSIQEHSCFHCPALVEKDMPGS